MRKIIEFPYLLAWIFLSIYILFKNKEIVSKNDEIRVDRKFFNDEMRKYIPKMEKLKPHIIGIFWIFIIFLIIK